MLNEKDKFGATPLRYAIVPESRSDDVFKAAQSIWSSKRKVTRRKIRERVHKVELARYEIAKKLIWAGARLEVGRSLSREALLELSGGIEDNVFDPSRTWESGFALSDEIKELARTIDEAFDASIACAFERCD